MEGIQTVLAILIFSFFGIIAIIITMPSLIKWLFPTKEEVPGRELLNYQGMVNPPTPYYTKEEIEEGSLTCLGYHQETELAEYIDQLSVFQHALTVGKNGVGKTFYFISTYIYNFIVNCPESSCVIFDAMDGVIEAAITLAKLVNRPYVVVPDDGCNIISCVGDRYERAEHIKKVYMQVYGSETGDGAHYHRIVENWLLKIIPLYEATYNQEATIQDLISLACEKEVRGWLVSDAPDNLHEKREYLRHFSKYSKKQDDLTHDLSSFTLFGSEITSGKYAHMLNQRTAPSLDALINDPRRPVIILRMGDYKGSTKYTLGKLGLSIVSAFIMNRDIDTSSHPCLFYIDEGGLMTNASSTGPETLAGLLATARKRHCGFIIGLQALEQVPEAFRATFVDNCATTIIQPNVAHTNAFFFAEKAGKAEYLFTSTSVGKDPDGKIRTQLSKHRELDYILTPDEIMNVPRGEVIILRMHEGSKRTPLRLKTSILKFKKKENYSEPKVPFHAPQTIWEERGYYENRPLAQAANMNQAQNKPTAEQRKQVMREAENVIQKAKIQAKK